jgi:hypothetical protein
MTQKHPENKGSVPPSSPIPTPAPSIPAVESERDGQPRRRTLLGLFEGSEAVADRARVEIRARHRRDLRAEIAHGLSTIGRPRERSPGRRAVTAVEVAVAVRQSPGEFRTLLMGLLINDITDVAAAVAEEVRDG